jgi:hypothetical protein
VLRTAQHLARHFQTPQMSLQRSNTSHKSTPLFDNAEDVSARRQWDLFAAAVEMKTKSVKRRKRRMSSLYRGSAIRHLALLVQILLVTLHPWTVSAIQSAATSARVISRRSLVGGAAGLFSSAFALPAPSLAATLSISSRFDVDILNLPAPSYASEFNGIDNTYFPSFLAGDWTVTQTLVNVSAPLGLKFIGGPNGVVSIAQATMDQARSKIGEPVELKLRYLPTKWGVAEDRMYNTKQRLNSFAGKTVVASVAYADVGGSNRPAVLAMGGTVEDPLQTTVVYFKGPVAQKNFVVSHGGESLVAGDTSLSSWSGYELQRSIFALTNQNTAPPITTDSEYIWQFQQLDDTHVRGKLRIAGYLNAQSDTLYFDARNRAVSLQDYTLDMHRISS